MSPIDIEGLGARIREARDALGIVQQELADRAGVRGLQISKLERAVVQDPHLSTIVGLAEAFGRSLDWLVMGAEPRPVSEPVPPVVEFVIEREAAEVEFADKLRAIRWNGVEPSYSIVRDLLQHMRASSMTTPPRINGPELLADSRNRKPR